MAQIDTGDLLTSSPDLSETFRNFSDGIFDQEIVDQHSMAPDVCGQFTLEHVPYPGHFDQLPLTDSFESDWNFNVSLSADSAGKTSWMFSTKLNKVFVKIDTHLNVYATYNVIDGQKLFVRAMIVYTSKNDLAEPVRKCPNHRAKSVHNNPEHILTCDLPDTQYHGNEAGKLFKDKLALLIPMSAIASNEPIKLKFTCQNSCSGMSRKFTSIVFTLENEYGFCYGRRVMHFKVCSCPKRDMERDEDSPLKLLPKKRKSDANTNPSTSKKVAVHPPVVKQESQVASVPMVLDQTLQLNVPLPIQEVKKEPAGCFITIALPDSDYELKRRALEVIHDMVAGKMVRTGDVATYQPYLNDIRKQIGK